LIYFDNCATSFFKPKEAINGMYECVTKLSVNPNRSFNALTRELSDKIFETRQLVKELVNLDNPNNVVFGLNCTEALNLAIFGSINKKNCHVITTVLEHNSVLRPLYLLQKSGYIQLTVLTPDKNMKIRATDVTNALLPNTAMVILSHVSNVVGATQELSEIGKICYNNGILFVVDASQSIGYLPIDTKNMHINLLAFPAHKGLHGIAGCGVLCFDNNSIPHPIKFGGTGTDSHLLSQPNLSPDGLESGTLNSPSILALRGALMWRKDNAKEFLDNMQLVHTLLYEGLKEIPKIKIKSVKNHSGIVTFDVYGKDSQQVCDVLANEYDIATRGGLHCAPLCHKFLGTDKTGLIRASVSGDNTTQQAFDFIDAIKQIVK